MTKKPSGNVIEINPTSKRNQLFLLILGLTLLFISFLLSKVYWYEFKTQMIMIVLTSLVVFTAGVVKYLEPDVTYTLNHQSLIYQHRMGKVCLAWQDIVRFCVVRARIKGSYADLPYIGIKVVDLRVIAESTSPRLANKLLHEQKELIKLALVNGDISLDESLLKFEPYQLGNSQLENSQLDKNLYKGPIAAWLYRCELLHKVYGVHIFLPEDSFDRDKEEFLRLLNQCRSHVLLHNDD